MVASTQTQLYTHAVEPKAVTQRKAKYRDDEPIAFDPSVANIMFDRRVVRGNTYAARIMPAESTTLKSTSGSTKKRSTARQAPPRTPQAVDGRRHIDIQTDTYLEELTDTTPETDCTTQTDAFLDRPPTPLFVPQKTGTDATTQILDGDLFDFDYEVEPVLEVLVGKILEQGLMEVLEEEELAAMRAHQDHFEQIRNAELVATQRMEAAEIRKLQEKERRMTQERERLERERVVRQKVAASTFARGYLSGILKSTMDQLQSTGFFYDPVEREVDSAFMPWLQVQAAAYLEQGVIARQVVKRLVEDATVQMAGAKVLAARRREMQKSASERYKALDKAEAEAAQSAAEEATRQRATFVLSELRPAPAGLSPEAVQAAREELIATAEAVAEAAWESAKAAAGEKAREEEESRAAAELAAKEEAAAAAAEAAAAAGEDGEGAGPSRGDGEEGEGSAGPSGPGDDGSPEGGEGGPPPVDVEALIAAAVAAVVKPEVKEITDNEVLSHLIEKGLVTKEAIVHSMAVHAMGDAAFVAHASYVAPPV